MIYVANFKMNQTRKSTKKYLEELNYFHQKNKIEDEIYIFPPSTSIDKYAYEYKIGIQNAYPSENGGFTGEIGLEQLNEFNINSILIGHSERRKLLNESQEFIDKKVAFFKNHNFNIIYCIGESYKIREKGEDEVIKYLFNQLKNIDLTYKNLIIAYEPIWAIGGKISASIKDITDISQKLKKLINRPILYGGSVNIENIKNIINIKNIDGVLVGSASLDVNNFIEIIKSK